MPYAALPDRRMPYDNDGTVFGYRNGGGLGADFAYGLSSFVSQATLLEMNDDDNTPAILFGGTGGNALYGFFYIFFPESREVTGWVQVMGDQTGGTNYESFGAYALQGSSDSTNGVDGTWETASVSGAPQVLPTLDGWRSTIRTVSFTGPKKALRLYAYGDASAFSQVWILRFHLYGEKAAGQTPDDLVFIDHDTTPGVEYASPEDFGDQPLGTTVVRQFRVKNVSGSKTANTINLQCSDTDFSISTDGSTWVATINITSLSAGAESSTMYVRCVTPAPGNPLGPRYARIVATVASYT